MLFFLYYYPAMNINFATCNSFFVFAAKQHLPGTKLNNIKIRTYFVTSLYQERSLLTSPS